MRRALGYLEMPNPATWKGSAPPPGLGGWIPLPEQGWVNLGERHSAGLPDLAPGAVSEILESPQGLHLVTRCVPDEEDE